MLTTILKERGRDFTIKYPDFPPLNVGDRIDLDGYGLLEIISKTYRRTFDEIVYLVIYLERY